VEFEWDEAKRIVNLRKHGVDFARVEAFAWETARETEDRRNDYGERRWIAHGRIGLELHVLIYTRRLGRIRVISLREASRREKANYAQDEA
jgi:uncharacterized DUF497 family protein